MAKPIVSAVYKIVCNPTGKFYVGSAVNLHRRWSRHVNAAKNNKHHCAPLQAAWNKYGSDSFTIEVLENIADRAMILEREQHWLDLLNPTFNVLRRAGNVTGMVHSQETRQRISAGNTGKFVSEDTRRRISAVHKGKTITEEHREALKRAHSGKAPCALAFARGIEARTGKPLSDETKQKLRAKALARPGRPMAEATKQKLREKTLAYYANKNQLRCSVESNTQQRMSPKGDYVDNHALAC